MAVAKKEVKPTPVKKVTKKEEPKPKAKVSETKRIDAVKKPEPKKTVTKKVETKPVKEEKKKTTVVAKKEEPKKAATPVKKVVKKEEPKKAVVPEKKEEPKKAVKKVDTNKPIVAPVKKTQTKSTKTVYHVSKREKDGREWKVFIQGSDKVIKLFPTQVEALDYAKSLCTNKDDGSYVMLHGLDGKIRKF